jgi:hypothetical protein
MLSLLIVACAIALTCGVLPAAAQEAGQTVKASIPPQAPPPVVTPSPARTPFPTQRPETAPSVKPTGEWEGGNVRLEVTISYQVGTAAPVKRTATLTVADQGSGGSLRSGNQIAVPQGTAPQPPAGGTAVGMISYNYKSVGLNVDVRNVATQGNRTKLNLNVEFSAVDEKAADSAGKPPSFPTFSQNLSLVLESGKPLIVGQSSDFVDNVERKQSVEVKATILR